MAELSGEKPSEKEEETTEKKVSDILDGMKDYLINECGDDDKELKEKAFESMKLLYEFEREFDKACTIIQDLLKNKKYHSLMNDLDISIILGARIMDKQKVAFCAGSMINNLTNVSDLTRRITSD